jgi:shikimate kinase
MQGRATAPAAGTVCNALATGIGAAFAIDADTTATVDLEPATAAGPTAQGDGATGHITGEIAGAPDADTGLVERCVELALDRWARDGPFDARIRTESEIPMASGLKSSSAAANATVLAAASALDVDPDPLEACRLGVQAARDAGVTVTGAFDDASASMLGGLTVTDNDSDELLVHDAVAWNVLVWTPPERAHSADADVARCERIAPIADLAADLARDGDYGRAMTVNGLAFTAALEYPADPIVDALPDALGASLSGTGPSYVAVADADEPDDSPNPLATAESRWRDRPGDTWRTTTRQEGASIQ